MSEQPIVGPDGQPVEQSGASSDEETSPVNPVTLVQQPAKVMRIGTMIKQLLDEVKSAPLDEAARARISARAIAHVREHFSRYQMCARTLAVYTEVLAARGCERL